MKKKILDFLTPAGYWKTAPRRSIVIFSLAVFFTFTTLALVDDILEMGRQPMLRLSLSVVIQGSFAVAYALTGIALRGRFWKAFLPLFAAELLVLNLLGNGLPAMPMPVAMSAAMAQLQRRLNLDGLASIVSISLGYAGFVWVFIIEGRRHSRIEAGMSRQQAIFESELEAAREVQQVILPEQVESVLGFHIESVYQPAQQVGGDFFQILPADEGGLLIVVGDVAGKGLPAAMLVSVLVGAIRGVVRYTQDPVEILVSLNDRLIGRTHGGFSTALVAHIAADGRATIANAGHLSPYLDGKEVELYGALPLGVVANASYETTRFYLPEDSRLTFYSDGVIEARNKNGELFGFDCLSQLVAAKPTAQQIAEAAVQFGQDDDITVLTLVRLA